MKKVFIFLLSILFWFLLSGGLNLFSVSQQALAAGPEGSSASLPASSGGSGTSANSDWSFGRVNLIVCDPAAGKDCTFGDLFILAQSLINFGIYIAGVVLLFAIIYPAIEFILHGNNPSIRADAKARLQKIAIGFFWIFAAWLLVNLLSPIINVGKGFHLLQLGS